METTGAYLKPVLRVLFDSGFELEQADLMANGLIKASLVPDEQTQQMRDLLRTRT
jgi:hypothetical protein